MKTAAEWWRKYPPRQAYEWIEMIQSDARAGMVDEAELAALSVGSVSGQGCGCPECVRYCSGWCSAELTGANYNSDLCPACELRADEEDATPKPEGTHARTCKGWGMEKLSSTLIHSGVCDCQVKPPEGT